MKLIIILLYNVGIGMLIARLWHNRTRKGEQSQYKLARRILFCMVLFLGGISYLLQMIFVVDGDYALAICMEIITGFSLYAARFFIPKS